MSIHSDHRLPDELQELEDQLYDLMPASMCCELHARLEKTMVACVDDEYGGSECIEEFESLELHLRQIAPASMPPNMIDRMVRAMDQWHDDKSGHENVIGIEAQITCNHAKPKIFGYGFYGAAAAVALLAAITAMFVSGFSLSTESSLASQSSELNAIQLPSASTVPSSPGGFAGEGYIAPASNLVTSKVINSKEGIVYGPADTPYRCVEVEYVDQVRVKSPEGRSVILSRPRKDRYFIPIKMH